MRRTTVIRRPSLSDEDFFPSARPTSVSGSLRVGDGEYMRAGNARRRCEIADGTNVSSSRIVESRCVQPGEEKCE